MPSGPVSGHCARGPGFRCRNGQPWLGKVDQLMPPMLRNEGESSQCEAMVRCTTRSHVHLRTPRGVGRTCCTSRECRGWLRTAQPGANGSLAASARRTYVQLSCNSTLIQNTQHLWSLRGIQGRRISAGPSLEPVRRGGPGVSAPLQPRKRLGPLARHLSAASLLVDLHPKAFRHARHFTFASGVAGRGGCACAATGAGARAVPGAVLVVLANPAEVVTVDARRGRGTGRRRLILAGHQATPRKGSASCTSKHLVALAAMKACSAEEISASVSAARWASASATSEVASRD